MDYNKVAVRYAKSLYLLAEEKQITEAVKADILLIDSVIKQVPEFVKSIESPIVKASVKNNIIEQIFKANVNEYTYKFLQLLITNSREVFLPAIVRNFLDLYRLKQGITKSTVKTVYPLDEETRKKIITFIESNFNTKVDLEEITDKSLIGGLVLRINDLQLDMSVAGKLERIEREFKNISIK